MPQKTLHGFNTCIFILATILLLSGCMTSRKLDKFVSQQYGDELPRLMPSRDNNISITPAVTDPSGELSHTVVSTKHVLPLLFYWQFDYLHTCTLNPRIFSHKFTNTIHIEARRWLVPKLGDRKLELIVKQLPHSFAIDDKGHMIWVILYAFGWDKVAIKPKGDSLLVSYKLLKNNQIIKMGEISVPDQESKVKISMFRSWKSATLEYISRYNYEIAKMSRNFMEQLAKEL